MSIRVKSSTIKGPENGFVFRPAALILHAIRITYLSVLSLN